MKQLLTITVTLTVALLLASCSGTEKTDNAQLETDISPVIPKINSTVTNILVDDNEVVKEGDTIILLDDATYRIAVQQAEVALAQAKQNVQLAKSNKGVVTTSVNSVTANSDAVAANIISAKAAVDAAKVKVDIATKNFLRFENLYNQKSATQQQFDFAKAEKDGAEQGLRIAEGQVTALQKQIGAAKSQIATTLAGVATSSDNIALAELNIKQAENNLEAAKLQLSYCTITAPADGVVSKKSVQKGQVVSIGQPLMAITNNSKIWVVANFKETQIAEMKEGQEVSINVDAYEKSFKGKVASFSQATGAKFSLLPPDNATGNFVKVTQRIPVKIEFTEPLPKDFPLRAGMSVSVKVKTGK
jgi:membrane fusion protein, multidrug efflux system